MANKITIWCYKFLIGHLFSLPLQPPPIFKRIHKWANLFTRKLVCWGFSLCYRTSSITKYKCATKSCITIEEPLEQELEKALTWSLKNCLEAGNKCSGFFSKQIAVVLKFSVLAILWWHCRGKTESKIKFLKFLKE